MPPAGFEPIIPADKRPKTHASERATTWIGTTFLYAYINTSFSAAVPSTGERDEFQLIALLC